MVRSGARDHGGRWNSKGVAVAYAAENCSLAALEQLVHLVGPRVLREFVASAISFDDLWLARIEAHELPPGWHDAVGPPKLREFGDRWAATADFPVLAVPSAIMRGEWNFLINPAHREFEGFAKTDPEEFLFDERLG